MDKYLQLIVTRFESYIQFLDNFEPTDEAAIFINNTFIYKEMHRVHQMLTTNKNLIGNLRQKYELYYQSLKFIFTHTRTSNDKYRAMIYSLQETIKSISQNQQHTI